MNRRLSIAALLVATALAAPARAQFTVSAPDGKSSLKLGVLTQVQAESLDNAAATATSQNIYLRRARLLFGGKLGDHVSLFMETDSPNLGKAGADGRKNEGTLYVQDLVLTYSFGSALKLDGGLLLVPLARQTGQAATTLLGIDYGAYAFVPSTPTQCRVGRDYGVYQEDKGFHRRWVFVIDPEGRVSFVQKNVTGEVPELEPIIAAVKAAV